MQRELIFSPDIIRVYLIQGLVSKEWSNAGQSVSRHCIPSQSLWLKCSMGTLDTADQIGIFLYAERNSCHHNLKKIWCIFVIQTLALYK